MELLIGVLGILAFSPTIRGLGNTYLTTDMSDLCKNENLTLAGFPGMTLDRGFIASSVLRCITIENYGVELMEGSFDSVPNLMYLDVAQDYTPRSHPFSFGELPNIRILRLGREQFAHNARDTRVRYVGYVGDSILDYVYPHLEYLDLRNNGISRITNSRENPFPKLMYIDLSGNRIHQDTLNLLPNTLLHLNLSDNQLSSLHVKGTHNLLSLRLDHNNIEVIGDGGVTFTELKKLVDLSIAFNRISRIEDKEFKSMHNLRYLNLTGNQLPSTHMDLTAHLPSLETLILDRNSFDKVPLISACNITTFSLNCNRITQLTATSFLNLPHLKRLHISGNMLESVNVDTFKSQKLLEELHLDGNLLSYLPADWCQYAKNLRYLNLAGNKFTSLNSAIYRNTLPMLELHLEDNPIAYINSSTVQLIPDNMRVYLNGDSQTRRTLCKFESDDASMHPPMWIDLHPWETNAHGIFTSNGHPDQMQNEYE